MPKKSDQMTKMPLTKAGLWCLLAGLLIMIFGFVLMIGGGSDNPQVFNYAMFDAQRLVIAPLMILIGVAVEIVAILWVGKKDFSGGQKEE